VADLVENFFCSVRDQIHGDNPAIIRVGATITGPQTDLNPERPSTLGVASAMQFPYVLLRQLKSRAQEHCECGLATFPQRTEVP
jgi:hypothetical protein